MSERLQDKVQERSILLVTGDPDRLDALRRAPGSAALHGINDRVLGTRNIAAGAGGAEPELLYFGGYAFAGDVMATDLASAQGSPALRYDRVLDTHGGFCAVYAAGRSLRISTDVFGMFGLYHAIGPGYAVVGSRFYDVVAVLKDMGVPLSLDHGGIASTLIPVGRLYEQASSPRTYCEQIKFLPVGFAVTLEDGRGQLLETKVITKIRDGGGASYKDVVREGARSVAANVLAAFNKSYGMLGVGLSGGYDSRVLLAALIHLGIDKHERVFLHSKLNPNHVEDLRVARRLAGYYGFEINRQYPGSDYFERLNRRIERIDPASAVAEFRLTHGPSYHIAFVPELAYSDWTLATRLTGGGGEVYRHFYKYDYAQPTVRDFVCGLTDLNERWVSDEGRDIAKATIFEELGRLDPEPEDWRSLRLHYTAWRNKMHFGRVEGMHRPVVNPMMDLNLAMASHMLPEDDPDCRQLLFDVFMLLEPTLAFLEFDDPKKAFDRSTVSASEFLLEPLERPQVVPSEPPLFENAEARSGQFLETHLRQWDVEVGELLTQQTEECGDYLMSSSIRPLMGDNYLKPALTAAARTDRALATRFRQGIKVIALADAVRAISG